MQDPKSYPAPALRMNDMEDRPPYTARVYLFAFCASLLLWIVIILLILALVKDLT